MQPSQPLGDQTNAIAPDFAQAIQAHWPDAPDASKTFTVPVSAGTSASSDYTIRIGFVSSTITYHYRSSERARRGRAPSQETAASPRSAFTSA